MTEWRPEDVFSWLIKRARDRQEIEIWNWLKDEQAVFEAREAAAEKEILEIQRKIEAEEITDDPQIDEVVHGYV